LFGQIIQPTNIGSCAVMAVAVNCLLPFEVEIEGRLATTLLLLVDAFSSKTSFKI